MEIENSQFRRGFKLIIYKILYDRLSTNAIRGLEMKWNNFAIIWNFLLEISYPYIDELLFTKFKSNFFRNGSFKIGSVRVLKSFRAQGDTKHHSYETNVIPTPPRTPTSKYFANFGFWCNGSIQIHLVLTYLDAIEYCKNLNSFVCKWFRFKDQNGIERSIYGTWWESHRGTVVNLLSKSYQCNRCITSTTRGTPGAV